MLVNVFKSRSLLVMEMQCIVVKDSSVVVIRGVESRRKYSQRSLLRPPTDIDDLVVSNDLNMGLKHSFLVGGQPLLLLLLTFSYDVTFLR